MMTHCDVTRAAGKLAMLLQAESIPREFAPEGAYWQVLLDVRNEFTNYNLLSQALPACLPDCPIAVSRGEPTGAGCFNYDLARDKLRTDARWLAMHLFDTWQTSTEDREAPEAGQAEGKREMHVLAERRPEPGARD